ncbi:MAG: TonB-dependent receptor plug domain-containing protein [Lewinellaceae bacterium]|nr:TonB-dependent receptor plug domain-containing protein [Lewinellaceae bacterium]
MKNLSYLLVTLAVGAAVAGCYTSGQISEKSTDHSSFYGIREPEGSISLIDHLRRVPGVSISGNDADAYITIRGIKSLEGSNEPLFVVDGYILNGGLRDAVNMVPVQDIKAIKVLKDAADTAWYGLRGSNGVIEITLK